MQHIDNLLDRAAELKVCIIIPTYNNCNTLGDVISDALTYCRDVIVVNDGSTDQTQNVLNQFKDQITLIEFEKNQGKGVALKEGLRKAEALNFIHAISMDSDGQHLASDLPTFYDCIETNRNALILGARDLEAEGAPKKSSFGNRFSNFWLWVETGEKLPDTQTGFRCYPLVFTKGMKFFTTKFEFEIEIMVRLIWRGAAALSVPVRAIYQQENRVSHFRPFKDFMRISVLNTVLVTISLLWYYPTRLVRYVTHKGIWRVIKEDLIITSESPMRKASAVGLGLFMGIVPFWGFQMLIALFLAMKLRLNKVIVLAFSNISIPPMIPFIIYGSYVAGGLFMEKPHSFSSLKSITQESIWLNLSQYIIGAFLLAIIVGAIGFLISLGLLSITNRRKKSTL